MVETDSEQIKECGDAFMWGIKGEVRSLPCEKGVLDRVASEGLKENCSV